MGTVIRQLAAVGRSMIVAAHDLGLVRDVAERVVFMVNGEILEEGNTEHVPDNPQKLRTQRFLVTMA